MCKQLSCQVRLNAVGVIIEGPKTTQLFSTEELECMKRFIDKNMNNSNPGFRQQLCAYIKKVNHSFFPIVYH